VTHEIDYRIIGDDMQLVEVELDPGETVIAEAGAMNYMDEAIDFQAVMGDGSSPSSNFWDKAFGAGKRLLTGESLFMTHFTNTGSGKQTVAFSAPYPGRIIPLDLSQVDGDFLCQKDAFLCAAKGTKVDIAISKRLGAGLFGGEGFILQRLSGGGRAFIHAGGTVVKKALSDERLLVDTGCLVGFESGIDYNIRQSGNLKSMFFGGEGLFLVDLQGTGTVYLQSLPFSRLAARIISQIPRSAGSKGESSPLGGLGNLFMGDRH
jgi:uncharacterized protein (TIGR00266 family)